MKKVKLFEEFVNEAKFKVGDTWEWNTQDGTKMVKIINIKPELICFLGNIYAGMHALNVANKNINSRTDYLKYTKSLLTF